MARNKNPALLPKEYRQIVEKVWEEKGEVIITLGPDASANRTAADCQKQLNRMQVYLYRTLAWMREEAARIAQEQGEDDPVAARLRAIGEGVGVRLGKTGTGVEAVHTLTIFHKSFRQDAQLLGQALAGLGKVEEVKGEEVESALEEMKKKLEELNLN